MISSSSIKAIMRRIRIEVSLHEGRGEHLNRVVLGHDIFESLRVIFDTYAPLPSFGREEGKYYTFMGIPLTIDYVNRNIVSLGFDIKWEDEDVS